MSATETDALRDFADAVDRMVHGTSEEGILLRSAADELERYRTLFAAAPHAYLECTARGLACSCWKQKIHA